MTIHKQSNGHRYQLEDSPEQEYGTTGRWRPAKKKVSRTTKLARRAFHEKKQELKLHEAEEADVLEE